MCYAETIVNNKLHTCNRCGPGAVADIAGRGVSCFDIFTQNPDGTCTEFMSQDGGELRTIGNPTANTGSATPGTQDFASAAGVGSGAAFPVVGAAVIGLAVWGKKKGGGGKFKKPPSLKNDGDNSML
ncbi:hypothetical protein TeGR_g7336 [Tetraparma gracilis]|jgi:hypothetical protein|uniref:Uncharacterized protein n=1 Tax=Tetraparma gracilis TaxID=2962635 RepID=A0ABQ6NBY7_9STRA|nr:hypothetical protein TeGR_g7336 [Tetraparma gracilis]